LSVVWKPQPKQELFLSNPAYEVLFGGTKGPGKTDAMLAESTRQIKNPNYRAIIFRRTIPRVAEVIDRSLRWFTSIPGAKFNSTSNTWTFPSGAKLKFAHCQREEDKWNYHGHEYHFMGFDQVEEFTETQYLFLMAQNRSSRPDVRCYIRCTANPGNIGHAWVKKRWIDRCPKDGTPTFFKVKIDKKGRMHEILTTSTDPEALSRAFIFSSVYDNEILLKNDPDYIKRLMMLPDKERKMLLEGDWDVFAGQFFSEWHTPSIVQDQAISSELTHLISLDYGYAQPASVGFWVVFPDDRLHRFKEIYVEKHRYDALGHAIRAEMGQQKYDYMVADPAIWGDKQHHRGGIQGESGAEILQGILPCPVIKADNSRIVGWGRMRIFIGNTLVTCSPNCEDSIRTIPNLVHDEKKPEDCNTDGEDHAADEWRYLMMSRPKPKVEKEEINYDILVGQNVKIVYRDRSEVIRERLNKMLKQEMKEREYLNSSKGPINHYMGNQW